MVSSAPNVSDELLKILCDAHAPAWYLKAVQQPTTVRQVFMPTGEHLHCVFWNEREIEKPLLLLVHGYRAHTHAWDPVAPFLTGQFRVLAVDLMGMGMSGRRGDYGYQPRFADDLAVLIGQLAEGPVTVVGHSFGGACSIHLAAQHAGLVKRLIIVDTFVPFPALDEERVAAKLGRVQPYPDYASIVERYRLLPEQPCPPWALAYIAHHSVRQVKGGWSWKFDTELPAARLEFGTQAALRQLDVPTDYIGGAHSVICNAERLEHIEAAIGQGRRAVVIPEAHHHIMLDQPLSLVSALRALLA
ncbi:alpha/beta hydrolase [Paraburkholderia sp.]|jgi:pimeloyl-ACP methyl ester carboxylesterase|uniref:alpha/beta fold hydrolase n=1 Tax=Paraburkholderia sp. TaxID=1926495 RepID=UPI002F417821